jgi:hypothetical protein
MECGGRSDDQWLKWEKGSQIMRMLIVTLSAALMLLSIPPQAGAAKSQLKCGGDNLQVQSEER